MLKMNLCEPFARIWNTDGTVEVGGDYSFSRKARKLGFEIYAHYDYPCHHFNEIDIHEIVMAMGEYYGKPSVDRARR